MNQATATPDYNVISARGNQRHIDASLDAGEAFAEVQEGLRLDMLNAMSGLKSFVTSYRRGSFMGTPFEIQSSVAEEVLVALDDVEACEALMLAIKESACPLMSKARLVIAKAYAKNTAEGVYEARGGQC